MGLLKGLGKVMYYGTGAYAFHNVAKRTRRPIGQSGSIFKQFYASFSAKAEATPLREIEDDEIRFNEAIKYYGADEESLSNATRTHKYQAIFFSLLTLLATAWGVYYLTGDRGSIFPLLDVLMVVTVHMMLLSFVVKHAFWFAQLRNRKLFSFRDWLNNVVSLTLKPIAKASVFLVALSLTLTGATEAYAQTSDGFASTDVFGQLLAIMISGVGPVLDAPVDGPFVAGLGDAFGAFSTGLVVVALLMITWQSIAGVVAAAHDGTPLSQKYHVVWAPLRVTFGIGAVVPVIGGFGAMQLIVLQLILWGGDLANATWSAYLRGFQAPMETRILSLNEEAETTQAVNASQMIHEQQMMTLAYGLLEKQVCVMGMRELVREAWYRVQPKDGSGNVVAFEQLGYNETAYGEVTKHLGVGDKQWYFFAKDRDMDKNINSLSWSDVVRGAPQATVENIPYHMLDPIETGHHFVYFADPLGEGTVVDEDQLARDGSVNVGGIPVVRRHSPSVEVNFGAQCGSVKIDLSDISAVSETLKYAEKSGFGAPTGRFERESKSQAEFNVSYQSAQFVANTAESLRDTLDAVVLNRTTPLAEMVVAAAGRGAAARDVWNGDAEARSKAQIERIALAEAYRSVLLNRSLDPVASEMTGYPVTGAEALAMTIDAFDEKITEQQKLNRNAMDATLEGRGVATMKGLFSEMEANGWAMAGTYYTLLARIAADTMDTRDFIPVVDDIKYDSIVSINDPSFKEILLGNGGDQGLRGIYVVLDDFNVRAGEVQKSRMDIVVEDTADASWWNILEQLNRKMGQMIMGSMESLGSTANPHSAMIDMTEFGYTLLGLAQVLLAIFLMLTVGSQLVSALPALKGLTVLGSLTKVAGGGAAAGSSGLLAAIGTGVKFIAILVLITGVIHAYILPFLGYSIYLFFVLGILVLVAESMIAAPIWALRHCQAQGKEFIEQEQKAGYMIAFTLLLRPALGVLGLILSYTVISAATYLLNISMKQAFFAGAVGHDVGVVGAVVYVIAHTYMSWQICTFSFDLITSVPDRVQRWFGQGAENLEERNLNQANMAFMTRNMHQYGERMGSSMAIGGAAGSMASGRDKGKK